MLLDIRGLEAIYQRFVQDFAGSMTTSYWLFNYEDVIFSGFTRILQVVLLVDIPCICCWGGGGPGRPILHIYISTNLGVVTPLFLTLLLASWKCQKWNSFVNLTSNRERDDAETNLGVRLL